MRGKGVKGKKGGAKKKSPIQKLGGKIQGKMAGTGEAQGKLGQRRKEKNREEKLSDGKKKQKIQNGEKSRVGKQS